MSILWEYADDPERQLCAPAVVLRGTENGASAAPSVPQLPQVVLGAGAGVSGGQLVSAGGAAGGHRPLAAPGDLAATDGGGSAVVDGEAGAVADVATVGR